jgi:hypothetical protein
VLVATLLKGDESASLVRFIIQDLRHPLRYDSLDEEMRKIAQWFNATQLEECTRFMEECGVKEILLPPKPEARKEGCVAYCPRCGGQFRRADMECSDCPGVAVEFFPER